MVKVFSIIESHNSCNTQTSQESWFQRPPRYPPPRCFCCPQCRRTTCTWAHMYLILSDVLEEWTLTSTAINRAYHILVEENFSRCDTSYCKWPPWSSLNVGWLRETDGPRDTHCHLLSRSGQLSRSHGGKMTFIARFVHIKQVGGKSNLVRNMLFQIQVEHRMGMVAIEGSP